MQATHQPEFGAWAWHHASSSKWLQGPVNLQFIWCLHSGKFSVPDQRLTPLLVKQKPLSKALLSCAQTADSSLQLGQSNCQLCRSCSWKPLHPSLQPWPAQLLEGEGAGPVARMARSKNICQSFRNRYQHQYKAVAASHRFRRGTSPSQLSHSGLLTAGQVDERLD